MSEKKGGWEKLNAGIESGTMILFRFGLYFFVFSMGVIVSGSAWTGGLNYDSISGLGMCIAVFLVIAESIGAKDSFNLRRGSDGKEK